jgi:hypothetical protein
MVWVGSKDVELRFFVFDSATSKPVGNATLKFYEDPHRFVKEILTDFDGFAAITVHCLTSGHSNLFWSTSSVGFPVWCFEVSKEGYETTQPEWLYQRVNPRREANDDTPETIRVNLLPNLAI